MVFGTALAATVTAAPLQGTGAPADHPSGLYLPAADDLPAMQNYTIGGVIFTDLNQYLAELRRQDDALVAQVPTLPVRLGGKAVVAIPNFDAVMVPFNNIAKSVKFSMEGFAHTQDNSMLAASSVFAKTRVFDSVTVVRAAVPGDVAYSDADYKVVLDKYLIGKTEWRLVLRDGRTQPLVLPTSGGQLAYFSGLSIAVVNAAAELGVPAARQPLPMGVGKGEHVGGAVFIDGRGHALTAAVLIEDCGKVYVELDSGEVRANIVARDLQTGLALLQVTPPPPSYARFAPVEAKLGDQIGEFGFPLAGTPPMGFYFAGLISGLNGPDGDPQLFQVSTAVPPGTIGSSIIDRFGNVAAITLGLRKSSPNSAKNNATANFAIKVSGTGVLSFLAANDIKPQRGDETALADGLAIGATGGTFTHRLTCRK